MKKSLLLILQILLISYFLFPKIGTAQGYIDCATILNDDANNSSSHLDIQTVNGYTYISFTLSRNNSNPVNASSYPVINGEAWHAGNRFENYLAVIDPNCNQILGTYIGGSRHEDSGTMAIDANGNIILSGATRSTDFVTTDGTPHTGAANYNIYLRKYALDGTILFSTLYGGSGDDSFPTDFVLDGTDMYLTGYTSSSNFATTNGTTHSGGRDFFVLKYDGSGILKYATLQGGTSNEGDAKIVVTNGQAMLNGSTESSSFPSTDGSTYSGSTDATLSIFDVDGNIVFSSVYGGSGQENNVTRSNLILTDGAFTYIAGRTGSTDFLTTDGSTYSGINDIYFRKYDLSGNLLVSKMIGGTEGDVPYDFKLVNGDLYVMGNAAIGFPTTDGSTVDGNTSTFIMKMDTNGNIIFSTVYGGDGFDAIVGFDVVSSGEIYLTSNTSNPFTTDGSSSNNGTTLVKYNADGSLCSASILDNNPTNDLTDTYYPEVINDTMYIVSHHTSLDAISTDGTTHSGTANVAVTKYVFCPDTPAGTTSTLTPSTINVCQNGLVGQIEGEPVFVDDSVFPQIYQNGSTEDQRAIELSYRWQYALSNTGPWSDIPGPIAQQQNYTPSPTAVDVYYRRTAGTSECCGGAITDISSVTAVLVNGNVAPTVDAGGVFYICPSGSVTIGGSPSATGGIAPYTYDWNDGMFTDPNPSVTPTQNGVYTLEVTDANGCVQVDQATVIIYPADAGPDTDVCGGDATLIGGAPLSGVPVVPTAGPSTPGEFNVSYDWFPTTGLSCSDCPNPMASPATTETYTLTVTIHYPDGTTTCNSTDDVTVGIVSPPSGAMTIGETVLCLGEMMELGTNLPPISSPTIQTVTQSSASSAEFTASIANLTDGDFSTGGHTNDGATENITIDFGSLQTISKIQAAAVFLRTIDDRLYIDLSANGTTWTENIAGWADSNTGLSATELTTFNFPPQSVRYVRLRSGVADRDVSISEFYAYHDYAYIWTPGNYIITNGSSAIFDPGNISMPTPNPITYTVSATLGTCTWYEQVTVAVIEARAGDDYCGPRTIGEADRTDNIDETYSWAMIADPGITTGTGSFLGATDEATIPVSASIGGNVGYELTTTYTLGGVSSTCKDTVIVTPCGGSCDIEVESGGCPDFSDGETLLTAIPTGNPADWTYSWTSGAGMVGLDNYTSQAVTLTDDVTRTYTVTMTSILDPTYTCTEMLEVNSPSFSKPTINVTSPLTTCIGTPINIGDPVNNSGLTYEWTNDDMLDNETLSNPEATVVVTTEFIVKVTDNVTGCIAEDTVLVIVPTAANAGPDFVVCDNAIVRIGANTDTVGTTYSWSPAGADWRNGTDEFDAMPEVFIATNQSFTLTATDTSGTCVSTDIVNVTVENIPATFTLPDVNFCPSQSTLVLGNDDGTTGGTSQMPTGYDYLWTPANVNDETLENPEVNAPLPTTSITYGVKVSTPGGCNIIATQTINPTIDRPITAPAVSQCIGMPYSIGDDSNPATVTWTSSPNVNTDLNTTTGSNPVFTPSSAGNFTFTATYTDGGCNTTAEVTIHVSEDITAPFLTPVTICEGNEVQIGVANDPTLSYHWDPATGLDNPFIANPTFSGTASTNFTLTVINAAGCLAETNTSVTVNPAPAFAGGIDYPDQEFCDPTTVSTVLGGTITPAGTYGYSWSPVTFLDDPNIANPTPFLQGEGTYEYTLEVIEQSTGCSLFKTVTMTIGDGCGTGTIGNIVWLDENGDGVQVVGESGISGVTVELKDGSGAVVGTTITDANGGYIFTDLPDDTYTVTVLSGLPTGAVPTVDEDGGTDQTTSVTITNGDEHMTADFGYNYTSPTDTNSPAMAATGALGYQIWNDADVDGVQDSGESGIANVTVMLFSDPDGNGVYDTAAGTTTTDANGNYIFDGIAPGAYVVEVDDSTLPSDFATTPTGDPDSDGDSTSDPIIVAPGDVVLIGDFGYQPTAGSTIGNLIFIDADGDGVQDTSEPGIEGVTVALEDASGNVIATTTTDANGIYSFPGLPAGTYDVVITDTDNVLGYVSPISNPDGGNDLSSNVTVNGTTDKLDQDFGFAPDGHTTTDGMIGSTVFLDTDNSNSLTAGEGVEGVTVELFAADGTTLVDTKTTDENGDYYFGALDPSLSYVVKVDETTLPEGDIYENNVNPDGAAPGTGQSTSDLSAATNGVDLTKDFGYKATTPNTISGTVWEDENADGTLDFAEANDFSGVTVDLLDANGNVLSTTTTDASGNYSFANLPDGSYTIQVTDTDEVLADTWHSLGTDSEPDMVPVAVSGGDVTGVDFGYYTETAVLGNRVWEDVDGNGIQDAGETGMAGVVVSLEITYPNGAVITVTTLTDANGFYSFDNLLLDEDYNGDGMGTEPTYTLSATIPSGYMNTALDATNDYADADDPSGVTAVPTQGMTDNSTKADPTTESVIATYDFAFRSILLPVKLSKFTAVADGCDVNLTWETESETDFDYFEIQRSGDGQDFRTMEYVEAKGGSTTTTYQYKDQAAANFNYYRLKMIDLDGGFEYSNIIQAITECESTHDVNIYPNPIGVGVGMLNVGFYSKGTEAQIQITDMLGRVVRRITLEVEEDFVNSVQIDISEFPVGSYTLQLVGDKKSKIFIIQE